MSSAPQRISISRFVACFSAGIIAAAGASAATPSPSDPTGGQLPGARNGLRPNRSHIFFPPFPPPFDPRGVIVLGTPQGTPTAPGELADFVAEYFYPQLSARLHEQTLTPRQRQQLTSYRSDKQALQSEIRREVAQHRHATPDDRHAALRALAARQSAALVALERTAEELRAGLITADRHWDSFREWRLSAKEERAFSPWEIAQVVRAAAFFEAHLEVVQRGWLREIMHELANATPESANVATPTYVFFSPSPARVVWPSDLSPGLAAKIAAYETQKSTLKKELYETVCRWDRHAPRILSRPFEQLAKQHRPKIQQLEQLAEEIRIELAREPNALALTPRHPLPPVLAAKIGELFDRRKALHKDATLRVESAWARVRRDRLPVRINFKFEVDGLKFEVLPTRRDAKNLAEHVRSVGDEMSSIAEDYGRELAALANADDEIRREIAGVLGSTKPRDVDTAYLAALRASEAERQSAALDDYRLAVFEPGLSPAQRRIMFDGSIEALEPSLPTGEIQPRERRDSW